MNLLQETYIMIDNATVFNNPTIPDGYYYAKIISIEQEPANFKYPKLLIKLKLHRMYGIDDTLTAILYPTEKSLFHYKNFIRSYIMYTDHCSFDEIPDVYGSIEICRTKYEETMFSSAKFVYMPRWAIVEATKLRWQDEEAGYVEAEEKKSAS